MIKWQEIFSKDGFHWQDAYTTSGPVAIARLDELKRFLDAVHIRFCLVKPYQEHKSYPLVEGRELLPSFDNDMFEYKDLPGFSMVAFARQLDYFSETFQFDKLHPIVMEADGACCPLENQVLARNVQTLASRLPRMHQDIFRQQFANADTVILDNYPSLMPYLLVMDRAQVLALDADRQFHLAGVFASFPSDIDSELKRFGMRIGKFVYGDSEIYERNRMFVYQYLMELYGFPIVSERRTSSALFARKLHKLGEHFMLRVLGQTDRTITTYTSTGQSTRYPLLEKIALISVDEDQEEALETLEKGGYFLDRDRRVVIIRVTYRQHRFDASNVQQDRALSVARQEILLDTYAKTIAIEASLMLDMGRTQILPVALQEQATAADLVLKTRAVSDEAAVEEERFSGLRGHAVGLNATLAALEQQLAALRAAADAHTAARIARDAVVPAMQACREHCDALERMLNAAVWPLPSYAEMLWLH